MKLLAQYDLPDLWDTAIYAWVIWLQIGGLRPATLRARRGQIRMIAHRSGTRSPRELTFAAIVSISSEHDWSLDHRKGVRTALNSFFNWAVQNGHADVNPAAPMPAVMSSKPRPRPCPDDIWQDLLAGAAPRERMMARLAGEVGMRRAEVAVCHRNDLIHDGHGWSLLIHGKGGRQRVVPITDDLALAIREYLAEGLPVPIASVAPRCSHCDARTVSKGTVPRHTTRVPGGRVATGSALLARHQCKACRRYTYVPTNASEATRVPLAGYLFPGQIDGHLSDNHVGKVLSELLPEGWSMHKLRHRYATRGFAATKDLMAVKDALGHVSVATTQIYVAVATDSVRAVTEGAAWRPTLA